MNETIENGEVISTPALDSKGYPMPPAGWSEIATDKHGPSIHYTQHGASFLDSPPHLPGWVCHFVARHGNDYTTWSYRAGESFAEFYPNGV